MAAPITITGNLQLNPTSVTASAKQVSQALGRITGKASEFQKSLDASTARVFAFGATTAILSGVGMAFKKMVASTIEVEKRLVEINSIFQATDETFNRFRNSIFQVAKDTGQSFAVVADGAAELARQGLSAEETATRLKDALVLTRISGLGAEQSVKALTAAINGFTSAGLSSAQIVNKLVAVDTNFAVSAQDLADGFARAGSTAEDAGVSFDELLGLITSVQQKTSRGGAVIGNAFKSIFTRLSRGSTIDSLKELGVEIDSSQSGVQKLEALAAALERTSDPSTASAMKELAGGVFQINVVSAALKDLSSETSLFTQATKISSQASNEASQKNAELNKTMAANINALVVGLTSIGEKMGSLTFGPVLSSLVEVAEKFSVFLDKAFDPEKGNKFIQGLFGTIGKFLAGPGLAMFTVAFLKIFTLIAKFANDGLKSIFEIGSATQKIKTIEGGIVDLLNKDKTLRAALASQTATQAQKEQAIITAIQKENALLTQQAAILRNIATVAASRGVGGYTQGGGFTGKGKKSFAHGFRAEEATAMALGAPKSVKAKKGKGTIGGKSFVMNSHETEVQNFGRNGDSAVIPHYAKGFVPNYARALPKKGVAAKKGVAKKGEEEQLIIPADYVNTFSFLVPQIGVKGRTQPRTVSDVQYKGGSPVFGLDRNRVADISNGEENMLADKVGSNLFDQTSQWVNKLSPLNRSVKPSEVGAGFKSVKGAKGALQGAIGSAFEVGITKALDYQAAEKEGGDFDVRGGNLTLLRKLFANDKLHTGDFKSSLSSSNERSFYGKIGKEWGKTRGKTEGKKRGAPLKSSRTGEQVRASTLARMARRAGKAGGYVPNFTQQNKGLPLSQIRAHFDGGGNPIAVTNTRDEPNGLKDAIGRERKGIGMSAAGGFVPNYVQPGGGPAVIAAANALNALTAATNSSAAAMKSNSTAATQSAAATGRLGKVRRGVGATGRFFTKKRGGKIGGRMRGGMGGMMGSMALSAIGDQVSKVKNDETRTERERGFAQTFEKTVKWGAIGMMMGGPMGAVIGAALGAVMTMWETEKTEEAQKRAKEKFDKESKEIFKRGQKGRKGITTSREAAFGKEDARGEMRKKIKSASRAGLDVSSFTKKRTALQKTALNLEGKHSAKAVEEAQTKLAEAFKNLAAVNVEQYVKDKKFLKASDDLLRSKVAALQIATQKQMAIANSTSGAFDTASQLNTDPALTSMLSGKSAIANAAKSEAEFESEAHAIKVDDGLSDKEKTVALTEASDHFAERMRESATLLQSTLNNEAARLKEIGVAMDNLGGKIFSESLDKIAEMAKGDKIDVKLLQDASLAFQKEQAKGEDADSNELVRLAAIINPLLKAADNASAGSGKKITDAAGAVNIEESVREFADKMTGERFDLTGVKTEAATEEQETLTSNFKNKIAELQGSDEEKAERKEKLAALKDQHRAEQEAIRNQPMVNPPKIHDALVKSQLEDQNAYAQGLKDEITKDPEQQAVTEKYNKDMAESKSSLRDSIEEGGRGESDVERDKLSEEKERVVTAMQSLETDIELFSKQFKTEGDGNYMDSVKSIDKALKAAADNVENLAGISGAMNELNKTTIDTIRAATEKVLATQKSIVETEGKVASIQERTTKLENQFRGE